MEKYELQKLRDLPIEGVAERLGLRVVRHKALCPFHDDHHASLSFSVRRNSFRCFVCGASGGTIDLVMRHLSLGFREACRWLADENNIIIDHSPLTIDHSAAQKTFDATRYERFFERPWLNEAARRFLYDERRLDQRVVRWCRLTSWTDRQGVSWLQIPYYNQEGRLIGVQNRNAASIICLYSICSVPARTSTSPRAAPTAGPCSPLVTRLSPSPPPLYSRKKMRNNCQWSMFNGQLNFTCIPIAMHPASVSSSNSSKSCPPWFITNCPQAARTSASTIKLTPLWYHTKGGIV